MHKALIIVLLLSSCSMMKEEPAPLPTDSIVGVGMPLPVFAVTMHDGSTLTNYDLKGKPSLIVFFSTTCPDCERELPSLNRRYVEHGRDTTFIAISREQPDNTVTAYWQDHGFSLPYSAQRDRHIYSLFARKGIPRIYISDVNGIIQETFP